MDCKLILFVWIFIDIYIIPTEPAVNPTARKKTNSNKSLGKELTISLIWVILPCAPQVYLIRENITNLFFCWGGKGIFFLFSKDLKKMKLQKKDYK